jgi:hypothetical protein
MILAPFFINTSNPNWLHFGLFLCSGGKSLWSIDDTDTDKDIVEMLKENGFPVLGLERLHNVVYAHIDDTTMKMSNFYEWSEIDPASSDKDVWRIFRIPSALWSCPVFKEHFWKTAELPLQVMSPARLSMV